MWIGPNTLLNWGLLQYYRVYYRQLIISYGFYSKFENMQSKFRDIIAFHSKYTCTDGFALPTSTLDLAMCICNGDSDTKYFGRKACT